MRETPSFETSLRLASATSRGSERVDDPWRDLPSLIARAAPWVGARDQTEGGGHSLWDQASSWVPEPEPQPEPPPNARLSETEAPKPEPRPVRAPPSVDPADIARELNLSSIATAESLNRLRRRFCWENHPDRYPDIPEAVANRRVAIANMLIDKALTRLGASRRQG